VLFAVFFQPIALFLTVFFLYWRLTRYPMLAYLAWIVFDCFILRRPSRGGRRSDWFRSMRLWTHFRDYFPVRLQKTTDLDPSRTYVFGYHPHGIIGLGAFCNFMTNATSIDSTFPGVRLTLLGLRTVTMIPFSRELVLWGGLCDVSRDSCLHLLGQGPGNAILIIVGGAREALDAQPGTMSLTLANRKGFVRIALETGSHLVPVVSFGENDAWQQVANSTWKRFQEWTMAIMGYSLPLFYGRGIFNYDWGLMPHRRPINTIVGAPIPVPKIAQPGVADVDLYHARYIQAVRDLFNQYKDRFGKEYAALQIK